MPYNSTIKDRAGVCETCKKTSIKIVAGKCPYCYQRHRAKVCAERNLKRAEKVKATSDLKLVDNSGKELYEWFERQMDKLKNCCIECGEPTEVWMREKTGMKLKRHFAIAHILSKSTFPSVSMVDQNWLELCQKHHTDFDSSLEKASKMKCFDYAVKQFRKFEHLITEKHKHLDLFREYADKHEKTFKKK